MDRSYMLNSYIKENEENLKEKQEAENNLDKLKFRINGSKSIEEIKKEVSIFLDQNDVSEEIKEDLLKICNDLNENTDLYKAETYLEEYLSKVLKDKEKEYKESDDTVYEIKEELIETARKDLESVGINTVGDTESIMDKIESEDDVIKLKNNIENATEYFNERNNIISEENTPTIEIPIEVMEEAINNPQAETVLETAKEEQENSLSNASTNSVVANEDGSVEITGDATIDDSMNFAAMMTTALATSNNDLSIDTNLDMKFTKEKEDKSKFRIEYGNFPLTNHPENKLDPVIISKIQEVAKSYNSNVDYFQVLNKSSIELATALMLINDHVLKEPGMMRMAVKNENGTKEMAFSMDENYASISTAFSESGAMVSNDIMENSIVRINNSMPGEQLMILNATYENLNQQKLEKTSINLENSYQKKLIYPNNINEAAHVNKTFLIVIAITEILLIAFAYFFIGK